VYPGRVLVTGAAGFVGARLVGRLVARGGFEVHGLVRSAPPAAIAKPGAVTGPGAVTWHRADLADADAVCAAIAAVAPTRLFHLGAMANPRACAANPYLAWRTNARGTLAVLRALHRANPAARALFVSTAQVYGTREGRIAESAPLAPASAYGRSKLGGERAARGMARRGLTVVIARPFNHTGAGQSTDYVVPALAANLARALATGAPLLHGNLAPRRDFLHVEDVLDAYEVLIERGQAGEAYNVCRGVGVAIAELLEGFVARLGRPQSIAADPTLVRAGDPTAIVGAAHRLQALGWCPRWSVDAILDELSEPRL